MLPKWHIVVGSLFSIALYSLFNISLFYSVVLFLSSVLVDVDHYLVYILKEKSLSLKNTYKVGYETAKRWRKILPKQRKKYKKPVFIFHGIEFWALLLLLSLVHQIFFFIFLGIIVHMVADIIEMYYYKDSLYFKISQLYVLITNQNKKPFQWYKV